MFHRIMIVWFVFTVVHTVTIASLTIGMLLLPVIYGMMAATRISANEVCSGESFQARCSSDEIIMIQSAKYGRMELGRCVKKAYGQLKCESDVLPYADKLCSGKQMCDFLVIPTTPELANASPCDSELKSYLDIEYKCLKVLKPSRGKCARNKQYVISRQHTTLSSLVTDETGCGSTQSPWVINASPGQKIHVSLTDFNPAESETGTCEVYGYIAEKNSQINETICGGNVRDVQVYQSRGNNIEIQILHSSTRNNGGNFLINYEVTGCPDLSPPAHAWYERDGYTALIGCEWSQHTWQLTCETNNWIGVVGNCSAGGGSEPVAKERSFSLSPVVTISLIVGLGVIVVTLTCIVIIGCICLKRNSRSQHCPDFIPPEHGQPLMYQPCRAIPIGGDRSGPPVVNQTPIGNILPQPRVLDKGDFQHIYETPLPTLVANKSGGNYDDQMTTATLPCRGTMPGPGRDVQGVTGTGPGDTSRENTWGGTKKYFDTDQGWVDLPQQA